ncbi:unnamed protein product [Mytilus coruscus]|uniref:Uncharacterized protein n=1 Tax=Mytilus coruscus TaxID=42192 RepID=A0A6J8ARX2_MYTCO|nr:unnamed protein product [Mytilus coruscus]
MASRRGLTRNPIDASNPVNWTNSQLKDALKELGINISINLGNSSLRRLYLDNVNRSVQISPDGENPTIVNNTAVDNLGADLNEANNATVIDGAVRNVNEGGIVPTVISSGTAILPRRMNPEINSATSAHPQGAASAQINHVVEHTTPMSTHSPAS